MPLPPGGSKCGNDWKFGVPCFGGVGLTFKNRGHQRVPGKYIYIYYISKQILSIYDMCIDMRSIFDIGSCNHVAGSSEK